ncbi:MAG: glycosyltransferase family 4 protein [Candidatus Bipolaricaulia bacterium]
MKVCIYLEGEEFPRTGIGTAYRNHKRALERAGVNITTDPSEDYNLLHLCWYGPKSSYHFSKAIREGKKTVAHVLGIGHKDSYTFSKLFPPITKRLVKYFCIRSDLVVVPTPYTKELLSDYGIDEKIQVISNGVDRRRFYFSERKRHQYRKQFGLKRTTIFSVGQVIPRKGIADFLKVAEAFPEFNFIWYGPQWGKLLSFYPEMYRQIKEKPPNVQFVGFVDDIQATYAAGDIFFFPSYDELQGIVLLESASVGVPIIIRDLPAYEGWLEHEQNCLKGGSQAEFIAHIERLAGDEALQRRLIEGGDQLAEAHSLERIGEQLKETYEGLLNQD